MAVPSSIVLVACPASAQIVMASWFRWLPIQADWKPSASIFL